MQKLLVVLPRVPWPLEKGDKLRAYHQLHFLCHHFEIYLVALSEGKPHPQALTQLTPFCKEIHIIPTSLARRFWGMLKALFVGWPLQAGYFYHSRAYREIRKILSFHNPSFAYFQLARTGPYARGLSIPSIIDFQDTFSAGIQRRIEKAPFWVKPFLHFEYLRLKRYETALLDVFTEATLISLPDRDLFPHPNRNRIHIIPNGVDFEFFTPNPTAIKEEWVLFTGNMNYPPNVDAARFLAKEIMPQVWKVLPSVKLILAGATPHPSVKALENEKTIVTGWINDMREYYNRAAIFVAPMRMGTGLQNKLLEAMAMQLPCVTSSLANQSLGAAEGREILIGKSAHEFASHVVHLFNDKNFAQQLASNGSIFVKNNYSWEKATHRLADIIRQTAQ
ncbi:MAG: polysaccharide biosynthesis protein PslH [Bacteroidales bacterium]|nr:polysaccharide biosynthesis protein PslH [Bacteroidales bacterium]